MRFSTRKTVARIFVLLLLRVRFSLFPNQMGKSININFIFVHRWFADVLPCLTASGHLLCPQPFFFFYLCLTRIQIAFQCLGWKGGRFNPMEKASCSAGRPNYSTLGTINETYASALDKTFGIFWPARFHEAISVLGSFMLQRKIHR